jgi:F0F1-type ATP synthase assembly protein I
MWVLLALAEPLLAYLLAQPAVLNAIRVAYTRKAVFDPNRAYFLGMLFGDLIKVTIALFLIWHAIRIMRRLIAKPLA